MSAPVEATSTRTNPTSTTDTQPALTPSENGNSNVSLTDGTQASVGSPIVPSNPPALATSSGNSTIGAIHVKKGLEGGAVAGIAVGMLLAGALIAGIVFFILLHRQKRRQSVLTAANSRQSASYTERNGGPEKRPTTVVAAPAGSIDDLLPQPMEDDVITGDLSRIRDNIKNHVRTYYHSGPVAATDINEAAIRDIAALTGTTTALFVEGLTNPVTRDNTLRSIIASVILARCIGERGSSLLPNELAALSVSMPASNGITSQSALYSKWKVVTGALLQQRYGKQSQDNSQTPAFLDTVASLDSILAPFVKGSIDGGQRRKNMDMILTRAANFAFLLFSQPGTFRFDLISHQGGLTIFPALVQIVGDQGQALNPVKILTEKEVVAA